MLSLLVVYFVNNLSSFHVGQVNHLVAGGNQVNAFNESFVTNHCAGDDVGLVAYQASKYVLLHIL